jgi:cell division septum initiation protein DivIVA
MNEIIDLIENSFEKEKEQLEELRDKIEALEYELKEERNF